MAIWGDDQLPLIRRSRAGRYVALILSGNYRGILFARHLRLRHVVVNYMRADGNSAD